MPGDKLTQNLRDRVQAVKDLAQGELGVLKTVAGDVMAVAKGQETSLPKSVNWPGTRQGLADEVPALLIATSDKLQAFVHKQIEITRRWV